MSTVSQTDRVRVVASFLTIWTSQLQNEFEQGVPVITGLDELPSARRFIAERRMVLDVVDSAFALLEERAEAAALLDAPELVESPGE